MATNKKKPTKKKNNKLETYGMHETSEFDQWSQSDDERNANIEEMPKERTEMEVAMETLAKTLAKSLQLTAKEDKKKKKMKAMEDECDMTVYIEEFEYLMEKTEVEEDEWANYLRPLLNSKARSAIAVLDIEERDDYELLKETILDQEDAARTSAAHSWWNLKLEKGQSVQEFVATIRRAAAKVPGATAKEVRDAFSIEKLLQSFPKHVAAQVRTQQPATLREAGKRVAEYFPIQRSKILTMTINIPREVREAKEAMDFRGEKRARNPHPMLKVISKKRRILRPHPHKQVDKRKGRRSIQRQRRS